jgi:predicted branched-subunit amino acid permease
MRIGFIAALPISLGVAAYGLAFGVLAASAGLAPWDIAFMGMFAFAGTSQAIAVERLGSGVPIMLVLIPALAVNLRYAAILASLHEVLAGAPRYVWPLAVHMVSDENWALTMARRAADPTIGYRFLIGSGACVMLAFTAASTVSAAAIASMPSLTSLSIGFAFTAAFIALARSMWRRSTDLLPWVVAFVTTVALQVSVGAASLSVSGGGGAGVLAGLAVAQANKLRSTAVAR